MDKVDIEVDVAAVLSIQALANLTDTFKLDKKESTHFIRLDIALSEEGDSNRLVLSGVGEKVLVAVAVVAVPLFVLGLLLLLSELLVLLKWRLSSSPIKVINSRVVSEHPLAQSLSSSSMLLIC